jgi:hypothetical protein
MDPITPYDGFSAEVVLPYEESPTKRRILKVLNAAATIGAVARDPARPDRYLVRGELFEFLSTVAKKAFEADRRHVDLAELERVVSVALLPRIGDNAETVLGYLHPIREKHGFMAEIRLAEVEQEHLRMVRNALNAGATLERVQRAGDDTKHYFIHGDFYRTLARIRGRLLMSAASLPAHGGALRSDAGMLPRASERRALTHRPAEYAAETDSRRDADLGTLVMERLLHSIGIEPRAYELVLEGSIHDKAINAGKALDQLKDTHTRLGDQVRQLDRRLQAALDAEHKAIEDEVNPDDVQRQLLADIVQRIYSLLPALMLTPDGPFERKLGEMIGKLEEAAASDTGHRPEDHALAKSLRALAERLRGLSRRTGSSWMEVGNALFGYEESSVETQHIPTGHYTKQ